MTYPSCALQQRLRITNLPAGLSYDALDRELSVDALQEQGLRRWDLFQTQRCESLAYPGHEYLVIYLQATEDAGLRFPDGDPWRGAVEIHLESTADGERFLDVIVTGSPAVAIDEDTEGTHAVDARAAYRVGRVARGAVVALMEDRQIPGEDQVTRDRDDNGRGPGER